jgi:hypothetical protein
MISQFNLIHLDETDFRKLVYNPISIFAQEQSLKEYNDMEIGSNFPVQQAFPPREKVLCSVCTWHFTLKQCTCISVSETMLLLNRFQTGYWVQPAFYPVRIGALYPGMKQLETEATTLLYLLPSLSSKGFLPSLLHTSLSVDLKTPEPNYPFILLYLWRHIPLREIQWCILYQQFRT